MRHGSLFSGIGGFDLAAHWMGWQNVFHCEINPFGRKVLEYHFPESKSYDDITKTDFTIWNGRIDILTGGFPCQPFSVAGKRKGTDDDRHLWPEMLRAIRECRPTWIVGENVPGLLSWDGGVVFEQVCADLEGEGYEVQPVVLPACSVGAEHKRERVFICAYSDSKRLEGLQCQNRPQKTGEVYPSITGLTTNRKDTVIYDDYGLPPRLDGITFPKWRNESIKAGGNAIVPQVVLQIFKAIEQMI